MRAVAGPKRSQRRRRTRFELGFGESLLSVVLVATRAGGPKAMPPKPPRVFRPLPFGCALTVDELNEIALGRSRSRKIVRTKPAMSRSSQPKRFAVRAAGKPYFAVPARRQLRPKVAPAPAEVSVFINAPFDDEYARLFEAIVFTVIDCGLTPRCALESDDGAETRISKIVKLVAKCKFGIHDISRTQLDRKSGLPRFNMPFELGLFVGAKAFGGRLGGGKVALVLDADRYRYQAFLSDLAGHDVHAHRNATRDVILCVRHWLCASAKDAKFPPKASEIERKFRKFQSTAMRGVKRADRYGFNELCHVMRVHLSAPE